MTDREQTSELQRLRAELDALRREQAARAGGNAAGSSTPRAKLAVDDITWNQHELEQKLKQVAAMVKDEAAQKPLLTLLLVFALGVLLGRVLR